MIEISIDIENHHSRFKKVNAFLIGINLKKIHIQSHHTDSEKHRQKAKIIKQPNGKTQTA